MNREQIYQDLKIKMEEAGFTFEKKQTARRQNRKEKELKFIHPHLLKKLRNTGFKGQAKKFYIKPLSDEPDCAIGLVVGKTMSFIKSSYFPASNMEDSYRGEPAWVNREWDERLDKLLGLIGEYVNKKD